MTEEEFRELQERVSMIETMTQTQGWEYLVDRARVTVGQRQLRLVKGGCKDWENYIRDTSFLEGMEYFSDLPKRLRVELSEAKAELYPPEEEEFDDDEAEE